MKTKEKKQKQKQAHALRIISFQDMVLISSLPIKSLD